jgi:spore coat polysaccharide biosynthesis protein SpsF
MNKRLVAAIACRNKGSRLFGKPLQNLDINNGVKIIDNIIDCLRSIDVIDEIVLGISYGQENEIFCKLAIQKKIPYILGDEDDVLSRLIMCGEKANATHIFRISSESPFLYFEPIIETWNNFMKTDLDAVFMDEIIDGSGFEIISLNALKESHNLGEKRHRSELCTLYIRENISNFNVLKLRPPIELIRKDLRLTVDYPEDLIVCRAIYKFFKKDAPRIKLVEVVKYLDDRPDLKKLIEPFTAAGYSTMNL